MDDRYLVDRISATSESGAASAEGVFLRINRTMYYCIYYAVLYHSVHTRRRFRSNLRHVTAISRIFIR